MSRQTQTHQILPHEMSSALDHAPSGITLLSLDCFDTLLWRDVHAPADVFAALPGLTPQQRLYAETMARKTMRVRRGRGEVNLEEIYAEALPDLGDHERSDERQSAIAAELEAEEQVCFAFAPTVELMRAAKAKGLEVIIVSDTYLSAAELTALIKASAGEEVFALIDRVFVSSEAGISKSEGLLAKALKSMKARPHQVLHVGDNYAADFEGARALGIPALHLVQFTDPVRKQLRLERACAQFDADRQTSGAKLQGLQPHRALMAKEEPGLEDPAQKLGFCVLGPVFTAFELWLRQEARALEERHGGNVHWLFMLRDGHLPHLVHQTFNAALPNTDPSAARIEISRFTATAASFTKRSAYERHFAAEFGLNPPTLARQMLLEESEIETLMGEPEGDEALASAALALNEELKSGKRQKTTMRRAREMAERLVQHVKSNLAIKPGDVLMLVDLGYNGSAQNGVDALLEESLGVHVAGRYLLCREMQATGLDKKGLIDARHYSNGFLEALAGNVAVIEQLSTCTMGSVIGYKADGTPIRKESAVKGKQSEVRDRVQQGVVRFAQGQGASSVIRTLEDRAHAETAWRDAASATLSRFLFLPQPSELDVVKSFDHDINLGSDRMVALFDANEAREGMRRRGLFYMNGSPRMFLPAELAGEDMSTKLALMVQRRFGLGLTYADYASRTIRLPVLYLSEKGGSHTQIDAHPTHDGYYVARLPVAQSSQAVALQLGETMRWVEIAGVTRSAMASLKTTEASDDVPMRVAATYDRMEERAPGLYECTDPGALMMVQTGSYAKGDETQIVEIVFRPIVSSDEHALPVHPRPTLAKGADTAREAAA